MAVVSFEFFNSPYTYYTIEETVRVLFVMLLFVLLVGFANALFAVTLVPGIDV